MSARVLLSCLGLLLTPLLVCPPLQAEVDDRHVIRTVPAGVWGRQPQGDTAEDLPQYPSYRGWYRYLPEGSVRMSAYCDGRLLCEVEETLLLLDAESGDIFWSTGLPSDYSYLTDVWLSPGFAFVAENNRSFMVISAHDGSSLCEIDDYSMLRPSVSSVWVSSVPDNGNRGGIIGNNLLLMDPQGWQHSA